MLGRILNSLKSAKRAAPRYPSFAMAEITDGNLFVAEVYVKEISATGARFAFDRAKSVPDAIEVKIPAEKIRTTAVVKWRTADAFGVEFTEALDVSGRNASDIDQVRIAS